MGDEFWAVWVEGKGFQNELINSKSAAVCKAEILSVINNSTCYVLKTIGMIHPVIVNGEFVEI